MRSRIFKDDFLIGAALNTSFSAGPSAATHGRPQSRIPIPNPWPDGLPSEMEERLARRYSEIFRAFLRHPDVLTRVTLWGVIDRTLWLNIFPIRGRTNYPLLFGRDNRPKPALEAVVKVAQETSHRS